MTTPARIVDAHHHLWDLSAVEYPWLNETGVVRFFGDPTSIQKNYLGQDFQSDFDGLPIKKSVHIQVGAALTDSLKETQWLDAEADRTGYPSAIVAFADLTETDLEATLDAHQASSSRLRGIRQIVSRSAAEDAKTGTAALLENDAFRQGLPLLARHDYSFDLQLTPAHLEHAARVFGDVPDLQVALCHAGSLQDFSADGIAAWEKGLQAFANQTSGICKVSGHGMFKHDWTDDSVQDWVRRVVDIFSPSRIAFGSNFPVDGLYASYRRVWEAFIAVTEGFSPQERDQMFATNAERFYRI